MNDFQIGDLVRFRYAPVGESGIVVGFGRGRVQVRWEDLRITTRHARYALLLASSHSSEMHLEPPPAPEFRMRDILRADRHGACIHRGLGAGPPAESSRKRGISEARAWIEQRETLK